MSGKEVALAERELLRSFVDTFKSGEQGASMDCDAAKALADAIEKVALRSSSAGSRPGRKETLTAIRDFCNRLSPASVQMSHGIERIYYAGIPLGELADAILSLHPSGIEDVQTRFAESEITTHRGSVTKSAIQLISAERERQIKQEGWSEEHDDEHDDGEMLHAAMCYMANGLGVASFEETNYGKLPFGWPWHWKWWKPTTPERDLVKSGALLLAERDRLTRAGLQHNHVDHKIELAVKRLSEVITAPLSTDASACPDSGFLRSSLNQSNSFSAGAEAMREALTNVRTAVVEADQNVLTCVLWMPERISFNETVVDYIDRALSALPLPSESGDFSHETFVIDNGDGSISLDAYAGFTRDQLKDRCGDLVRHLEDWRYAAVSAATDGNNKLENVREPYRSQIVKVIEAYSDEPAAPTPPSAGDAEPVAYLHELDQPRSERESLLSFTFDNPWPKITGSHPGRVEEIYKRTPLYTHPTPEPEGLREALADALSGWRYIRSHHGDLYGVGWDRVENKLTELIAALSPTKPVRQYFYKDSKCKAETATSPDCICWHDEGTGPLANVPEPERKNWRDKPATPSAKSQKPGE